MKNIWHLLDVVDKVRDHVALGLMSDPGLSKTSQVKQWAEAHGRRYCELIISQRMPSEISGMPMPVNKTKKMEVFDFNTLLELEEGDVLAFDEFTNGNIQTLNACLTLIQERTMLSGHKLPSLIVVAMGNPQGRCDLLPQTKQRFWWVTVGWDAKTWISYIQKTWHFRPHNKLVECITQQYRDGFGNSDTFNYYTPRTVENLLRVAMEVERTDPFWSAGDIPMPLVDALYASISDKDTFYTTRDGLIAWVQEATDYAWSDLIAVGLSECNTLSQLRSFIEKIERNGMAPEFIAYLKEEGTAQEWAAANPQFEGSMSESTLRPV